MKKKKYWKAKAVVTKRGIEVEGYFFEKLSIGGHETYVIVPKLKSAFDIGKCPSRAIQQNFIFITHAYLDHIVSSTIWPEDDDVEKLLDIHRTMGQMELNLDLVALDFSMSVMSYTQKAEEAIHSSKIETD
ncbi:hypothetical protein REPUB_Repub17cG0027000 [Reevesia pubescens]